MNAEQAKWDISQLEEAILFEQELLEKEQKRVFDKIKKYKDRIEALMEIVSEEEKVGVSES